MKKTGAVKSNILQWIFSFLLLAVGSYFVFGELFLPADAPGRDYFCEEYRGDWVLIKEDGTRETIQIPGKYPAKRKALLTIESTLPNNLENGKYLCFRSSKQDVKVYVDGVLREEYSTENTRPFGKTSAVAYLFVQVNQEDAGKVLSIETRTDSPFSGIFYGIYYGDQMGIWKMFFPQNGGELVFAFFALLLSVIGLLGSMAVSICFHKKSELEFMSWGVLLMAVWLIANSAYRQLLFPNVSVIGDMTFFMIMLLPFPFVLYIDEVQKRRYHKWYVGVVGLEIVNSVLCTILHVTNVRDFADTIVFMAMVCFLAIGSIIVTMIMDMVSGKIKEYWLVSVGIAGSCLGATIQIVLYFQRTKPFNGMMVALGLVFMLVVSFCNTIQTIVEEEKQKQKALAAGEAKARFLATISHEIRTPITAVLGMDEMILRESKDEKIKEYAGDIQNAGQSLLDLINDVLDMSKIEAGKMQIVPEEYGVSSLFHDVISMMTVRAKERNLDFQVQVDETLPSRLYGDKNRIRQILINIIGNALKYTREGNVVFIVTGDKEGDRIVLHFSVKDTGIGIKEEDLERLSGEFERFDAERNQDVEGSGLGLNITGRLLELMDSRLQVKSQYGVGSEFSFDLSQKIVQEKPIGNFEQRLRKQTVQYSHKVQFVAPEGEILVVDDNEMNRKVFAQLLKGVEVQIDEASSGSECLRKTETKHYDLIFLDHMMPELDGVETLHRIREMENNLCVNTPIVALTANAVSGAREMYLAEGFDDYLSKPIIPANLEKMLQELLPEEKKMMVKQETGEKHEEDSREEQLRETRGEEEKDNSDFPNIKGMDIEYALLHVPERHVLKMMIGEFYRLTETDTEELESLYCQIFHKGSQQSSLQEDEERNELLKKYCIKVHAMKSSASWVGLVSLAGIANILEDASKKGKLSLMREVSPVFLEQLKFYKAKLRPYVEGSVEKREVKNPAVIVTYLELLKDALIKIDLDILDGTMEELRQYQYEKYVEERMEQLGIAVSFLDMEKGIPLIEEIIIELEKYKNKMGENQ